MSLLNNTKLQSLWSGEKTERTVGKELSDHCPKRENPRLPPVTPHFILLGSLDLISVIVVVVPLSHLCLTYTISQYALPSTFYSHLLEGGGHSQLLLSWVEEWVGEVTDKGEGRRRERQRQRQRQRERDRDREKRTG